MKRVPAGAHLSAPWFLSQRNAQTIEPTTAWAAVSQVGTLHTRFTIERTWASLKPTQEANSGDVTAQ